MKTNFEIISKLENVFLWLKAALPPFNIAAALNFLDRSALNVLAKCNGLTPFLLPYFLSIKGDYE